MRRLRSPRALAVLAVPALFGLTATSLHSSSVVSRRAAPPATSAGSAPGSSWAADRAAFLGERAGRSRPSATTAATTPAPAPQPRKVRPAPGAVTGVFGEGRGGHRHPGLDIDGTTNDPVVAAYEGDVSVAGWAPAGYSGYGIMIVIDHGMGLQTLYAHLAGVQVQPGQHVTAGQVIGTIGSTGHSTGSHLHFEVHIGGALVDPAAWLAESG